MVDNGLRGIINTVVNAVVSVAGAVAGLINAVLNPGAARPAAAPLPASTPQTSPGETLQAGPEVCDDRLCAEYVGGRFKVTFTPAKDLPHGFLGVVTGPDLELTGKSTVSKGANATYTGYFDVGDRFRKGQQICTKIFAIDGAGESSKQGEQQGKEVCVAFTAGPQ